MGGLAEQRGIQHAELWEAMRRLHEGLSQALDRDGFMDGGLDVLIEVLGADRGLILLLSDARDGCDVVINARRQRRSLTTHEREEVSKAVIGRVLAEGRSVIWNRLEQNDGSESMRELGIMTALAAPLRAFFDEHDDDDNRTSRPPLGVLYVDFRQFRKRIGPLHREFFDAAAVLFAGVLQQAQRLTDAREHARAASAQQDPGLHGHAISLDAMLAPPSMAALREEVASALVSDLPLFIQGESGTGKSLLAHAIAAASGRTPVVRATLGQSDDLNTITSELFGHQRGAFSGAVSRRVGLVEFAHGGTLIFDEVLNLAPPAQQLLLDFTQFKTYRPLGYSHQLPKRADVRIIAATNGDLPAAMRSGRFRDDLYHRLAGFSLHIPALRERREDAPMLAESILRRSDPARPWRLSVTLRRLLLSPDITWPGNIRQLEHTLRRGCARALAQDRDAVLLTHEHIKPADLGCHTLHVPSPERVAAPDQPLCSAFQIEDAQLEDTWDRLQLEHRALQTIERQLLARSLELHQGVVAKAARALGMPRTTFVSRLERLGLRSKTR